MKYATRTFAAALAALVLVAVASTAEARGRHGGGHWGAGPFWGGVGIGLGVGLASYYYRPWYPGYVVVEPPAYYYEPQPVPQPVPRVPAAPPAPDPIFYPRSGQSPTQTEADRVECNRWATTQPSAMSDASVFQRATLACMEGRGYVVR
jgi:hypothetical protein